MTQPKAANAARVIPKVYKDGTSDHTDEYKEYVRRMTICHDLLDIAKKALGRPDLTLKTGTERDGIVRAATDGSTIFLPSGHPNLTLVMKHELAHIYFDSDIAMRFEFVNSLLRQLAGGRLHTAAFNSLLSDLCFIINVFDDVRVNSLWGLVYPGDGRDMADWYQGKIGAEMLQRAEFQYKEGDIDKFAPYAILIVLDQPAKSTKWSRYRDDIITARDAVMYKTFAGLLLIVRDLVTKITKDLLDELGPGGRPVEALENLTKGTDPGEKFDHHDADFDFEEKKSDLAKEEEVKGLLDIDLNNRGEVEARLEEMESEQLQQVVDLREKMDSAAEANRNSQRKVRGDVVIRNVGKHEVVYSHLTAAEASASAHWKSVFRRVSASMEKRVSPEGYELIPSLYLQQKINKQPFICYRRPQTGRGFRVTLLIDLSKSMTGDRFAQAESLYKVLRESMDFPYVHMDVVGFSSRTYDQVDIVRFEKGAQSLTSPWSRPDGWTPLPQAIQVAGEPLKRVKHQTYLFVITDGKPVFVTKNSTGVPTAMLYKALVGMTEEAVLDLKASKVTTFCFMVAPDTEVPSADMDKMFGPNWKRLEPERLFDDAFSLIKDRFLQFLRTR